MPEKEHFLSPLEYERFWTHDELIAHLVAIADAAPDFVELVHIGASREHRSIPVCIVTDRATGGHGVKPGLWLDGGIHAPELFSTIACVRTLTLLLERRSEKRIAELLRQRSLYFCPRLNPDGAEASVLAGVMDRMPETRGPGLRPQDLTNDGRVLLMRVKDPAGAWTTDASDARLMRRRGPAEANGVFYHLYEEGLVEEYDGFTVHPEVTGTADLNRNFPGNWLPESAQRGAGAAPASEPEVRAMCDFLIKQNNICCVLSGHTFSGVLLGPPTAKPLDSIPASDEQLFRLIGETGEALTGYPWMPVFGHFQYERDRGVHGASDWAYEARGMLWQTIEYWAPHRSAGISHIQDYLGWIFDHGIEDEKTLLAWNDRVLNGQGFAEWQVFEHPQLGKVEIGGWDRLNVLYNPPVGHRLKEAETCFEWIVWLAQIMPNLEIIRVETTRLGADLWRVRATIQNAGFLPTNVSERALENNVVSDVTAIISPVSGAASIVNEARVSLGQLSGRLGNPMTPTYGSDSDTHKTAAQWHVTGPPGTRLRLTVSGDRAGHAETVFQLSE